MVEDNSFKDEPLIPPNTVDDNYTYFLLDHIYTRDQLGTYKIVEEFRSVLDEYTHRDGNTRYWIKQTKSVNFFLRMNQVRFTTVNQRPIITLYVFYTPTEYQQQIIIMCENLSWSGSCWRKRTRPSITRWCTTAKRSPGRTCRSISTSSRI